MCPFYRVPEHSTCQAVSRQMQAFYTISYRAQEQNKRDTLYIMQREEYTKLCYYCPNL